MHKLPTLTTASGLMLLAFFIGQQSSFGDSKSKTSQAPATVVKSADKLEIPSAAKSSSASASDPHRIITLHFPERSVGRVFYVISNKDNPISRPLDAKTLNAKGDLKVPADQPLSVMLNYDGGANASFFDGSEMKEANIVQVDMHDVESGNDETIRHCARLPKLRRVLFNSTDVTDVGLKYLGSAANIYGIVASGSLIKGPGIEFLQSLSKLHVIELTRTNLRDCKFESLPPLKHLRSVSLANCVVNDSACAFLGKLPELTTLDIARNKITDAGIARLTGLKFLTSISLEGTAVTSRVAKSLVQIPCLRQVSFLEDQLSPEAITAIRKALPACHVEVKSRGDKFDANLFAPLK